MNTKLHPLVNLTLVLLPLFILVGLILYSGEANSFRETGENYTLFEKVEIVSGESIPFSKQFQQLGINIRYSTGETLQNGVFVTDSGLMRDWKAQETDIRNQNNHSLISFSEKANEQEASVYFAIIPTSSGVLQKKLPQFSNRVNQRSIIENSYNQLTGKLTSINVYNTLSENQDKYIYYRTEDNLTALGGYYVYRELVSRLLSESDILPLSSFNVRYEGDYYGALYSNVPYYKVRGDTLSFYDYKGAKAYTVKVYTTKGEEVYEGLYPKLLGTDQYVGGGHYPTKLYSNQTTESNLLVIGDSTATSFLPFMANNYSQITFINIYQSGLDFTGINLKDYDQIFVSVGIENYTNNLGITDFLSKLAYN